MIWEPLATQYNQLSLSGQVTITGRIRIDPEFIPSEATHAHSLLLQVWHAIDIVPVATSDDSPSERIIHPVTNNLVSSFSLVLRLRLSRKTGNPTLGQPNCNIDFIAAQRCDHMARTGWERSQGDLVWEGGDGRRAQGQV